MKENLKPLGTMSSIESRREPNLRNLIYTKKWDECIEVTKSYPRQAVLTDRMGDLPLHEACNSGAPFQLVQILHRTNPSGIQQKGFCGRLPLHYASYSKPSLHVIKFLLTQYPDGAQQFDDDGRLPLHLAVVRNAPKQAIQALIAAYPKSLSVPNHYGNTPVMLARNDHVHELLLEEQNKPRGVTQKLDIEKKLMKDWYRTGKTCPVNEGQTKTTKKVKPSDTNAYKQSGETGRIAKTKSPMRVRKTKSINNADAPKTLAEKQQRDNIMRRSASTTRSTLSHIPQAGYLLSHNTPKISNKAPHSTNSTKTANRILSSRRTKSNDTSNQKTTSIRSRSLSSGRSRRTIEATYHDMDHLEDTTKSQQYMASKANMSSSRVPSPKSPMDYGYSSREGRRPSSTISKREVMKTNYRRKVLPSPTRMNMVVHPVWK